MSFFDSLDIIRISSVFQVYIFKVGVLDVDVAPDGILPCIVLGVYTILAIYILALMVCNTKWIVSLASHIALAEPTLNLSLSDAYIGQYASILNQEGYPFLLVQWEIITRL